MRVLPSLLLTMAVAILADGFNPPSVSADWPADQADYQLQTIVVTATRTPQVLWESDANVAVLTDADIRQSFAQHLGEALRCFPGINVGEYGGVGQNVSLGIRGSTAGQVLILMDGVPINDPQLGGLDLNLIDLDNVQRVEVVRGSASALYGADAMGGVVNIITRSATYEQPKSDVTYQQGNDGFEKIGGRFCRRWGQHLGLNVVGSDIDYDGFRENSDYSGRHLAARISCFPGSGSHIAYSTQFYQGDLGVPGMLTLPTPSARQEDRSWNHTLTLQVRPGEGQDIQAVAYGHSNRQRFHNPDWSVQEKHGRWIYGLGLQHSFPLRHRQRLTWGAELQHRRLNSSANGQHELFRGAVYGQDELGLNDHLRLRLAARYDHHQTFKSQLSPDLTITWLATPRASLFASWRGSYRAPTFNDLFWPSSQYDVDLDQQPDYRESGNTDIKPEKALAFQTGSRLQLKEITGQLCFFHRRVRDLIQWDNVDQTYAYGFWMPVNKSSATIQGCELQLTATILNGLKAEFAYTFLQAKDNHLNKRLAYQPEHQLVGYLQHGWILIPEHLELTVRLAGEHLGESYADGWEGEKLSSVNLFHGHIGVRVMRQCQLYLMAKNLGDERYSLRRGYPLAGRTFTAGLSWELWN